MKSCPAARLTLNMKKLSEKTNYSTLPILQHFVQILKFFLKYFFFFQGCSVYLVTRVFVSNKVKGRISKRLLQKNKAHQIFRLTNISYPLIRIRTCAYQGVRNVRFSKNLVCFVFL